MIKAVLTGRLGKPAEVRALQGGRSVINFNVAVDQGYGDKKTTLWVECSYFTEKTGVAQYLQKGTSVAVFGEPSLRQWESNGKSGASFTLNVSQVELTGGKQEQQQASSPTAVQTEVITTEPNDLPF
jgi:single-strand DNA-binding protein